MKGPCLILQNAIFGNMERFYLWFGKKVAKHPGYVILCCLIFAGFCCAGTFLSKSETDELELFVPRNSDFYRNSKWIEGNFPSKFRVQEFIMVSTGKPWQWYYGENIVTKSNLDLLNNIMKNISRIR